MVLTQQPGLAHRFYTDGSSLTNAVAGASGVTVYGQTAINEKIMSLNLEHARVEVESVDAQYSLLSGVAVLITGHMTKVVSSQSILQVIAALLEPLGQLHQPDGIAQWVFECMSVVGKGAQTLRAKLLSSYAREGILCSQ